MQTTVRWGILGTGTIAKKFAAALQTLPDAKLVAVGSRCSETAENFARQFHVPRRHTSYDTLANDPDVDAIYIATPHSCHQENTLLCLNANKPVLCEKPFTINAAQAAEVIATARNKKLLVMEAMWTRFFPLMFRLREMLAAGVIGEIKLVAADFGFRAELPAESRLFNPAMGGGALLDVGVYPVSLASMILGAPLRLTSTAELGATGVDEQAAMICGYSNGALATLYTSIRATTFCEASILGTQGRIKIHSSWWKPSAMTFTPENGKSELIELPFSGNGYQFEAMEFMNCLRTGKLESAIMPLDETHSVLKTLDALRAEWGLKYPME
jgi:predicted dehydrogenase